MERVIFFGRNDMAYGLNFKKIESIEIPEYESIDINDAIEYYEIKLYFDDGARGRDWTDEKYKEYKEKSKKLFELSMRFFNAIGDDSILEQFQNIDNYHYRESFWRIFDNCKLYKKISGNSFQNVLTNSNASILDICKYRKIVEEYGCVIKDYILNNICIDVLLYYYEKDYTKSTPIFLPKELSGEDICKCIENYVDSENPFFNHLETIRRMKSIKGFNVSDLIKLKAKRRYDEKSRQIIEEGVSIHYGINLIFTKDQEEVKIAKEENGRIYTFSYSTDWLTDTLDFPSILNNFIYVFEYTDIPQMRCLHVVKESQSGVFERIKRSKSSRIYPINNAFNYTNGLAQMQMSAYYDFLHKSDVRYETVLEWFFTQYLQEEYGCAEIRISLPSEGSTYKEKCVSICSEFESLLKQFSLFVEHQEIDFELLEMIDGSKPFGDIPSLVEEKYIYGIGKDFELFKYLLFSDQCMLSYVERVNGQGKDYSRFFDLITNEDVFISDYMDGDQLEIQKLQGNGFLTVNENGLIKLGNKKKIMLIKDLNDSNVISRWHYSSEFFPLFQEWIEAGILKSKSSLLSDPEINYFNFILNHAEYDNGLNLRNKYSHGNQQAITDEEIHKQNYYTFLRVFTILAIKINDDFSLRDEIERANKQE